MMIGDPCYQPYRSLEYNHAFNNQNNDEKMHTKILLNVAMVPPKNFHKLCLMHNPPKGHDHHLIDPLSDVSRDFMSQQMKTVEAFEEGNSIDRSTTTKF